jgi:hypothetical protein
MKKVSAFKVFERMMDTDNKKFGFYPLASITDMQKVKQGSKITFGCEERTLFDVHEGKLVGGFVACDREEFNRIKAEMEVE